MSPRLFCSVQLRCTFNIYFSSPHNCWKHEVGNSGQDEKEHTASYKTKRQPDGGLASLLPVNGVLLKIMHICWLWRLLVQICQALHPAWQPCVWLSVEKGHSGEAVRGKTSKRGSYQSEHIRSWIIWEKATSCCCFFNNASAWWRFPLHHGAQFPNGAARLFDIYREIGKRG